MNLMDMIACSIVVAFVAIFGFILGVAFSYTHTEGREDAE